MKSVTVYIDYISRCFYDIITLSVNKGHVENSQYANKIISKWPKIKIFVKSWGHAWLKSPAWVAVPSCF